MRFPRVVFVCVWFSIGALLRPVGLVGCGASDTEADLGYCGPYPWVPVPGVASFVIVDAQNADMVGGTVEIRDEFEETAGGYMRLTLRFSAGTDDYDVVYMWPQAL